MPVSGLIPSVAEETHMGVTYERQQLTRLSRVLQTLLKGNMMSMAAEAHVSPTTTGSAKASRTSKFTWCHVFTEMS
jgi:hypothetical protein